MFKGGRHRSAATIGAFTARFDWTNHPTQDKFSESRDKTFAKVIRDQESPTLNLNISHKSIKPVRENK